MILGIVIVLVPVQLSVVDLYVVLSASVTLEVISLLGLLRYVAMSEYEDLSTPLPLTPTAVFSNPVGTVDTAN